MQKVRTKTARFAQVVQECGRPEAVTLWQEPDQDRRFQKALREDRVMTVSHELVGTKKDFGMIGYLKKRNTSFLVFPKSLSRFHDKRIVGINFKLIAPSPPWDPRWMCANTKASVLRSGLIRKRDKPAGADFAS